MELKEIERELGLRKKGSVISIRYITQPTLKASAKNYKVEKETETIARFGIEYSNIKAVKEKRLQDLENGIERKPKTIWWNWKDKNIIKQHNTNGNYYLTLTTSKIARPKTKYYVNGVETTKEQLQKMDLVIPSYWNEKEPVQQYDININNIITIKRKY